MERKLGMQDREFWSCYFQKFDIILEQTAEKLGGGVGYVNYRSKNIEVYKAGFILWDNAQDTRYKRSTVLEYT